MFTALQHPAPFPSLLPPPCSLPPPALARSNNRCSNIGSPFAFALHTSFCCSRQVQTKGCDSLLAYRSHLRLAPSRPSGCWDHPRAGCQARRMFQLRQQSLQGTAGDLACDPVVDVPPLQLRVVQHCIPLYLLANHLRSERSTRNLKNKFRENLRLSAHSPSAICAQSVSTALFLVEIAGFRWVLGDFQRFPWFFFDSPKFLRKKAPVFANSCLFFCPPPPSVFERIFPYFC